MDLSDLQVDPIIKIVFVGDIGVGKSSILTSFTESSFHPEYQATIGVDFRFRKIVVDKQQVKLQIWDTAGHERYRSITNGYYRGSHIICFIYDITSHESFENLTHWMEEVIRNRFLPLLFVIIGNKCDREKDRQVSQVEAGEFAKKYDAILFETSAKTHKNLDEAFHAMALRILQKHVFLNSQHMNNVITLTNSPTKSRGCCWM